MGDILDFIREEEVWRERVRGDVVEEEVESL